MVTVYLSIYLIFVIAVTLIISLMVLKLKLPSPRLIVALILLFILSPLIVGYFYLSYFDSLPEVVVPDVSGMTFEAAKEKIESLGLQARPAGEVYDARHPEGRVASQRPEAGRKVKAGRTVNLMVSSGQRKVATPSLLGRNLSQADAVLSASGLQLGEVRSEQNQEAEEGTILAQEPLPGEEAVAGSRADLLVSTTLEVIIEESSGEVE